MTLTVEFSRPNVTLTFDHTHVLDQGLSWSNFEIAVSQNGRADWHWAKGWGSFMTMTVIIWWPRSGVRIQKILTGVTSDVGVPSTHLIIIISIIISISISISSTCSSSNSYSNSSSSSSIIMLLLSLSLLLLLLLLLSWWFDIWCKSKTLAWRKMSLTLEIYVFK